MTERQNGGIAGGRQRFVSSKYCNVIEKILHADEDRDITDGVGPDSVDL